MKKVLMPLVVPSNSYCWEYNGERAEICRYFDNSTGKYICEKGLGSIVDEDKNGVLKPEGCRLLLNV